jgi:peptidoglycan/xylan/chitin deacetylase (PgdA/CDA1 family)
MGKFERTERLLEASGILRLAARASRWRGVLVLAYHRIGERSAATGAPDVFSVTQDELDAQLRLIAERFELIAPSEVPEALHERRGRFAAITFDDGYRDNYTAGLPVLMAHGVRAGFFICTGFIDHRETAWWDEIAALMRTSDRITLPAGQWLPEPVSLASADRQALAKTLTGRYKALPGDRAARFLQFLREAAPPASADASGTGEEWMTWEMIRDLRDRGMEIGGHTVTHPVLARHPTSVQADEIFGCADRLDRELGEPMRLFAYPVGLRDSFGPKTRRCLSDAGVKLAFSCYGGLPSRRRWDPLDVRRVPIGFRLGRRRFQRMLELPRLYSLR